jgi:hypothetical protein
VHVLLLAPAHRPPLVLLVDVRQYVPLGMPPQDLLVETALHLEGLPAVPRVVDVDEVAVAARRHEAAVSTEGNPLVLAVRLVRKDPLADDLRNAVDLQQRVLGNSGELLIVAAEGDVGDPPAVGVYRVADQLVVFSGVQRY